MPGTKPGVALVTGAASGIGAAIAGLLAERGWRVAGLDLDRSGTELALQLDVSDREAVQAAAAQAADQLGPPTLLVTAAGVYEMAPVGDIGDEAWRRMLAVNLGGVVNACWAVLPGMLASGTGTVVTISSELALAGGANDAHYVAAKGAILGFTRSLALELAPRGVRVNGVAPGPTDTPLLDADSPWRAPSYLATLPLGRLVVPDEVAQTVLYLVEEGTYFAGQTISPNAGAVI
ncbi:MAG TPA: SDR family oxidoreductase [Thermoleophilaceae bacterium]|nr:SDR family oxidoreductase [Thermoleophilaceae bacterium]